MQRIIEAALENGSVSTYTGSAAFPTGEIVGGVVGGVLLIGLVLTAWRRPLRFRRTAAS